MEYKKNSDGEFLLDENGEKIPEGTEDKGGEDANVELMKKLADTNKALLEEVKTLRGANKDLKEKTETKEVPATDPEESKIASVVQKVLSQEKAQNAETNKQVAFEKFVTEHKEFHPDNDPTGLKLQALKNKFNNFNTNGIMSTEGFMAVIRDAHTLLGNNDKTPETQREIDNPYSSNPESKGGSTKQLPDTDLSSVEKKLIESGKVTKEKLLKLKSSQPGFYKQLINSVV